MYQEFYAGSTYVSYALAAFVFFFGAFLFVLARFFVSGRSRCVSDSAAYLPLEDDCREP